MFNDITGLEHLDNEINKTNIILNDINNDGNIDIDYISINSINKYLNNSKINVRGNLDINNKDILNVENLILSSSVSIGGSVNINEVELSVCRDNIIVLNKPTATQGLNVDSGIMISYNSDFNPSLIYKKKSQSEKINGMIDRFVIGNIDVSGGNIDANGNPYSGNVNITDLSILHINSLEGNLFGNLDICNETPEVFMYGNVYIDNLIYTPNYYERTYNYKLWNPITNTLLASNIIVKFMVINRHVTMNFPKITIAAFTQPRYSFLSSDINMENNDIPIEFRPTTMVNNLVIGDRTGSPGAVQITYKCQYGNYIMLTWIVSINNAGGNYETISNGSTSLEGSLEWII